MTTAQMNEILGALGIDIEIDNDIDNQIHADIDSDIENLLWMNVAFEQPEERIEDAYVPENILTM